MERPGEKDTFKFSPRSIAALDFEQNIVLKNYFQE